MNLEKYGYNPQDGTKARRRALDQAILKHSFDTVLSSLFRKMKELDGYREDRITADLKQLSKDLKAGKYLSDSYSFQDLRSQLYEHRETVQG
jgi:hypothetical protein